MLKQFCNISLNQTRNYAFKSNLKIKWIRPEKIASTKPIKSGDLEFMPEVPKMTPAYEFRDLKELETADEVVRKMCSLGHHNHKAFVSSYKADLVKRVQRHKYDDETMEVQIAKMTARIHSMQKYLEKNPRAGATNAACKELIDKRKKFLKYLRRWDYKRFEWLLERLSLVYKSPPSYFHWITRKESLTKLTDIHCEEIKKKKMDEYKAFLIAQRTELLKEFDLDPSDEDYKSLMEKLTPETQQLLKQKSEGNVAAN